MKQWEILHCVFSPHGVKLICHVVTIALVTVDLCSFSQVRTFNQFLVECISSACYSFHSVAVINVAVQVCTEFCDLCISYFVCFICHTFRELNRGSVAKLLNPRVFTFLLTHTRSFHSLFHCLTGDNFENFKRGLVFIELLEEISHISAS